MTLAEIMAKAAAHKMTPAERRAQRISMIYGLQSFDSKVTKEQIADWLDRHEGRK